MSNEYNPQEEQMADESMVRNLDAQAKAIWPQEEPLFERYGLTGPIRILDVGCGTGEISSRLAKRYPEAEVTGVDLLESSLDIARDRYADLSQRLVFEQRNAFDLGYPENHFDLIVCRHMLQAVPRPGEVMRGFVHHIKPGGWLHLLNEDYTMLHMQSGKLDSDRLWHQGAIRFLDKTGTDGRIGRNTYAHLLSIGLEEIRVDYVVIDTLRVPRETFATIMAAWRDGYTGVISENTQLDADEVKALFEQVIETVLDPQQYAVWQVPVIGARVPK